MTTLDTVTEDFVFSNRKWISELVPSYESITFETQPDGSSHYMFQNAVLALGDKCIATTRKGDPCKNNIKTNFRCGRHQDYEPEVHSNLRIQVSDCDSNLRPIPATLSWDQVIADGKTVLKKGDIVHMPVSAVWNATIVRLKHMIQILPEKLIRTDDGKQYYIDPIWTVDQFIAHHSPKSMSINNKVLESGYFMHDYLE